MLYIIRARPTWAPCVVDLADDGCFGHGSDTQMRCLTLPECCVVNVTHCAAGHGAHLEHSLNSNAFIWKVSCLAVRPAAWRGYLARTIDSAFAMKTGSPHG
eukprot:COSAG01_NODE_362_length_18130_cov_34.672307_5_plen_101_part_00